MECDGRLETAIREMDAAGVTRFAVHSVATTPHQVHSINEFVMDAARRYPDRVVPFAALHPGLENAPGAAQALKVLVHCGDYRYDNSCPARIKHVLRAFPRLRLVCAHLGG